LGGGTANYVRDVSKLLKARGILSLFAQPDSVGRVQLSSNFLEDTPNLIFAGLWDEVEFLHLLRDLHVARIHLHHFIGFAPEILNFIRNLGIPVVVTLHDYSYVCPQVVLLNQSDQFCGAPDSVECNRCIAVKPPLLFTSNVAQWRRATHAILSTAERVIAPSQATAKIYNRVWPDLTIKVLAHPETALDPLPARPKPGAIRTIAIVGTVTKQKGAAIIEACVRDADDRSLPLKFIVIGEFRAQLASSRLDVLGPFRPDQLPNLLSASGSVIGFLPSVWPETYSYVLTSYYRAGLHPVVFDIGAQAERVIAMGGGTVLPLNMGGPAINDVLVAVDLDTALPVSTAVCLGPDYVDACYGEILDDVSPTKTLVGLT
jgi:glycosyltransferase involved in cell wall biosynthesis